MEEAARLQGDGHGRDLPEFIRRRRGLGRCLSAGANDPLAARDDVPAPLREEIPPMMRRFAFALVALAFAALPSPAKAQCPPSGGCGIPCPPMRFGFDI